MEFLFLTDDNGDWVGMYVDGKLAIEGHSLSAQDAIEYLKDSLVEIDTIFYVERGYTWFEENGGKCPSELTDDIKEELKLH